MKHPRNAGFTIIELLIATAVLSTILVLVTSMMISISRLYYKGINQSRIQDNVRSISDEVAQQLQLTKATPISVTSGIYPVYCIGNFRYTYVLGMQLSKQINHVLWRDKIPSGGSCLPVNLNTPAPNNAVVIGTEGVELMAPSSRLLKFSIPSLTTPYKVGVEEAYGDTDLLCDNGTAGDCNSPNPSIHIWNSSAPVGEVHCKGEAGQQFCATARLSVTVAQRLR